jgi:UDP-N-acetylglucosamine/UDP-N-acetylgalactosamine 4-epimerase
MNILITGGAGFIGSNLARVLLANEDIQKVVVIDNLSNGFYVNIAPLIAHPKFQFIEGDISDYATCLSACENIDLISHQAALGSVPRSINDPIASNNANVNGTLNIFTAAKEQGVKRVVFAASSSTYGDSQNMPKVEHIIGKPLSPYAVTKYVMELYADVFAKTYGLEFIGLRYFNVFGPYQSPTGAYAAVIPLFINACLNNEAPKIFGDGTTSRDFTFIENVIDANLKAIFTTNSEAVNQIYNIAFGSSTSLNQLFEYIKNATHANVQPQYLPTRAGDIPHSLANIEKATNLLGYNPMVSVQEGLVKSVQWYASNKSYFQQEKIAKV